MKCNRRPAWPLALLPASRRTARNNAKPDERGATVTTGTVVQSGMHTRRMQAAPEDLHMPRQHGPGLDLHSSPRTRGHTFPALANRETGSASRAPFSMEVQVNLASCWSEVASVWLLRRAASVGQNGDAEAARFNKPDLA